ncbi:MAG TPA: hypothetical protein VKB71_09670, partial [Rhizomicrobium sp.]|nr:hypothetical protein [Rhizomicrobium sp.]
MGGIGWQIAGAIALALAATAARADTVTTENTGGFGRMIFTLDPAAHAKPALAGGVLTITFDRQ